MKESVVYQKSVAFALDIIQFTYALNQQRHYVLAKQILRSSTSIGANIAEALDGQSRKDFLSKMSIALKEANETKYWLYLIEKSHLLTGQHTHLQSDIQQLYAILNQIVKTTKSH